ncbi:MAG: hypothetical protein AAFN80_04665 [Pseudomonadota bacterium]
MRHILTLGAALVIGVVVWLWGFGGADHILSWATAGQERVQNAMAHYLQDLRAGNSAALTGLWGLCFAYGFFHAAGPGHGKLLIGGYGLGAQVPLARLSVIAILSSLAQAAVAVALVYAGVFILGLSRTMMTDVSDKWLAPASYAAIAAVGVWLLLRGVRHWRQARTSHHHDHHDDHVCHTCGHRHAPDAEHVAQARTMRDTLVLIGAIAIRPCTGALFLLILTVQLGIGMAGVVGAFIMGLGTASVTLAVAIASVTLRDGLLARLATSGRIPRALPLVEMAAGALVAIVSLQLMMRTL